MLMVSSLKWLFEGCLMKSLMYIYKKSVAATFKTIGPLKKRNCNDISLNEMVDWAEMEVEKPEGVETRTSTTEVDATDGVEARTSTIEVDATYDADATDKGKEKISQDATKVVETRRRTVETDSKTEYYSDDDSDYQPDKSVDYLSPGEEELIKLRNRMKANREAKAKAKDNLVSKMNEPNDENSMPADNVRGETFEEHDIYMNELLKSLNTADKDGIAEYPFIFVGEKHVSVSQFKECRTYYALANGFSLWYERSGEYRVVAKCGQRKPRLSDPEKGKQRKQTRYPNASSDELLTCPWRCYARLCDIADLVMKKYKCKVSPNQCTNAKKYALTEYEKTIGEHYAMLRSYGKEILDSNPGSTSKSGVTMNPDGKTYFDSPNQGEILTAIGRDRENHIYPVAWAVVNVENKDNWTSFLELLKQDLGSSRGNGLTLMSDQHKGLMEAVKDVMPNAKHMQCARHIYENFRKQYPGLEFRQLFWASSKASHPQLFNKIMDKIKSANLNAHKYLMDKNPKTWSRAFFEVDRGCEAIENGFSECFNSVIVNVRHKPLLTMLEAIRVIVLERMNKMREISRK
ncbi:multidrug resistance-associated protein 5 [Tanacetum coccineum]